MTRRDRALSLLVLIAVTCGGSTVHAQTNGSAAERAQQLSRLILQRMDDLSQDSEESGTCGRGLKDNVTRSLVSLLDGADPQIASAALKEAQRLYTSKRDDPQSAPKACSAAARDDMEQQVQVALGEISSVVNSQVAAPGATSAPGSVSSAGRPATTTTTGSGTPSIVGGGTGASTPPPTTIGGGSGGSGVHRPTA